MIQNDAQLSQALQQLERLYRALGETRSTILPENPGLFAIMAEGPLKAIDSLQSEIDEYSGRLIAIESQADIWLRVLGTGISWPFGRTSIVTSYLDALRRGIFSIAEQISKRKISSSDLKKACDLDVVSFLPGSLRIGVKLPESIIDDVQTRAANRSLTTFLDVANWAGSSQDQSTLQRKIEAKGLRRAGLNAVKSLIPRSKGPVDQVEIKSKRAKSSHTVRLTQNTGKRIVRALERSLTEGEVIYEGVLRELDLDGPTFILRQNGTRVVEFFYSQELAPLVIESLDRNVRIIGTRKTEPSQVRCYASSLEVIDEDEKKDED